MNTLQGKFDEIQARLESSADVALADSRFGRSRLLRLAGGALFGWAVSAFLPSYAWADCPHNDNHPCYGYNLCGGYPTTGCENREAFCCSDINNKCHNTCDPGPNHYTGCSGGGDLNCWHTCHNGNWFKCCDCHNNDPDGHCICRFIVGTC